MKRLVVSLSVALVLLAGCVSIQRPVEVTPGTVPSELRGATWSEDPVPYCVVRNPEGGFVDHETLVGLTRAAVESWGIETRFEGDCPGPLEQENGRNEVSWGNLEEESASSLSKAGNTNMRYRTGPFGDTPSITEADIVLDRHPPQGKDTQDCLFTTLLHEAGHFFGLHHIDTASVMSPVITDCLQEPTAADREALEALY